MIPSYFGLMIPLRAMHSRQLSLTLPVFTRLPYEETLRDSPDKNESELIYYTAETVRRSISPGTWKCTVSRSQSVECHTPVYGFWLDAGLAGWKAHTSPLGWGGKGNEAIFFEAG